MRILIFVSMIIVTGASGFIGSALLGELQRCGYGELIAVDEFSSPEKKKNLENKNLLKQIHRDDFIEWLTIHGGKVQCIFHLGARTKTNEYDLELLQKLNVNFSKDVWGLCCKWSIPLIYASSAATYGDGSMGFEDDPALLSTLHPLNPYGNSKQTFDLWVQEQALTPPFWAGFKFFNVFGANEYHKGRMASVVFHAFNQIKSTASVSLFKSYREDIKDGEQKRDFVYIKDVLNVLMHFMEHRKNSGIYNLGSGQAHTFLELVQAVFTALDIPQNIQYIDMPEDIRGNYQYFTEANLTRLRVAGYTREFTPFAEAVSDYVIQYLDKKWYL